MDKKNQSSFITEVPSLERIERFPDRSDNPYTTYRGVDFTQRFLDAINPLIENKLEKTLNDMMNPYGDMQLDTPHSIGLHSSPYGCEDQFAIRVKIVMKHPDKLLASDASNG